ncbi:MAG: RES family NAD+ phosphorylase [Tagaea sp.]|nr:RES family NAD+ phosphorylase [Tagaea sp.]
MHDARDHRLLDALDALPREAFAGRVWRVVPEGRNPAQGHASLERWGNGAFDVLYTSLERDGAIAEIHEYLNLQPVFPSKPSWSSFELAVRSHRTLRLADLSALKNLDVDIDAYRERRYARTQAIADAAFFLGFDGLIAPSARWPCDNLMLFTAHTAPADIEIVAEQGTRIDWTAWRRDVLRAKRA